MEIEGGVQTFTAFGLDNLAKQIPRLLKRRPTDLRHMNTDYAARRYCQLWLKRRVVAIP